MSLTERYRLLTSVTVIDWQTIRTAYHLYTMRRAVKNKPKIEEHTDTWCTTTAMSMTREGMNRPTFARDCSVSVSMRIAAAACNARFPVLSALARWLNVVLARCSASSRPPVSSKSNFRCSATFFSNSSRVTWCTWYHDCSSHASVVTYVHAHSCSRKLTDRHWVINSIFWAHKMAWAKKYIRKH